MAGVAATDVSVHPLARCCWCEQPFRRGTFRGKDWTWEGWICPTPACHTRQHQRAMVVQIKGQPTRCRFVPLPRQIECMEAVDGPATYVLFGGARGGTKSKAMREIAHAKCMATPNFRVLLLRRTFRELEDNHLINMEIEAPTLGAQFVPSSKLLRYPNGSTLRFGHCETSADAANYLSSEYDLIIFDELVTFEQQQYLLISSSARSTKPGVQPKIIAGTNPGGPQSYWVRSRFLEKNVDTLEFPDYRPEDYVFIPSKLEDNPYLDKSYEAKLMALPPALREAYRNGSWDVFPGQYFPEFRRQWRVSQHDAVLLRNGHQEGDVLDWHQAKVNVPEGTPYVRALDWGYDPHPGVCLWIALLPDGRAYVDDEYVFYRTIPKKAAQDITRRTRERGLKIRASVGDTQMWTPEADTGQSIAETFALHGVPMQQADKDRINGWQRLREWFACSEVTGKPWLVVSPKCEYVLRTIPSLISDTNKPLDVDTDGEDHAGDCLRYFVMSRPVAGSAKTKIPPAFMSLGWLKQQAESRTRGVLAR